MIITYQDFEKAKDKNGFIQTTITNFKASDFYLKAMDAEAYYRGENTTILQRKPVFYGENKTLQVDVLKANNQVCNEFFPKIIKQANSYLLSNGITLDDNIKKNLGKRIDVKLQRAGISAWVQGVSWAYCFIGSNGFNIDMWKGTEFIPLFDEETNVLRAGIRFWQIDLTKPIYIELYEENGVTKYSSVNNKVSQSEVKKAYKIIRSKDALEDTIIGEDNWSVLPILPLYSNDLKTSALTTALKNKLDLYDIVLSDFGNNLEDSQDVYWVLKNYQGQDLSTFLDDYKYYKSIKVNGDGDASPHTIEVPYQARDLALKLIKKDIYEGAMAVDPNSLQGGSITNVVIKAMMMDLDLKTDEFENNVVDFMEGIIELYQEYSNTNQDYNVKFIRRTLINDTEIIDNIMTFREDITRRKALELNPYIEDSEIDDILDAIDEEDMKKIEVPPEENNPAIDKDINLTEPNLQNNTQ